MERDEIKLEYVISMSFVKTCGWGFRNPNGELSVFIPNSQNTSNFLNAGKMK